MATIPDRIVTPEEYLAFERASEEKHEYINGRIYPLWGEPVQGMAGASPAHQRIQVNLIRELGVQLRGCPCEPRGGDMRVKVSGTGLYTYPDVTVICGDEQLEDAHRDTLLNPVVVIEILSPSTENYDRVEKFEHYRRVATLHEYVLVAHDRPHVERFTRHEHFWALETFDGLDATLPLPSIDCALPLRDVYDRVAPFKELPPRAPRLIREPAPSTG